MGISTEDLSSLKSSILKGLKNGNLKVSLYTAMHSFSLISQNGHFDPLYALPVFNGYFVFDLLNLYFKAFFSSLLYELIRKSIGQT